MKEDNRKIKEEEKGITCRLKRGKKDIKEKKKDIRRKRNNMKNEKRKERD